MSLENLENKTERDFEDMQGVLKGAIEKAAVVHMPINVTIELSQNCNLRCVHCYNFDRKKTAQPESTKPALEPQEIMRILSEIRRAGGLVVAFSGGEALLQPRLLDFVREARRLHMAVRLKSNGTLISPSKARELKDSGVSDAEISLYGTSPETHDRFTRKAGSFERTLNGIRACRAAGIQVQINFILHRGCIEEFDQMAPLAESLDSAYGVSTELTKRNDGTEDSLHDRLNREDFLKLYQGIHREMFAGLVNKQNSVQCSCAKTNAGIGFDGTVFPCIGAQIPSGDLRRQSFDQIWKDSPTFNWIRSLELKDFKECAPCELRPYCQRSSGAVLTNTGNYTGKEDWLCMQAGLLKELNESLENKANNPEAQERPGRDICL